MPKVSVHSYPKETTRKVCVNTKTHEQVPIGIPLPTNTTKLGERLGMSGGHPIMRQSTTLHISVGTNISKTMGAFPVKPLFVSQSQRKLRPSDFKNLINKFDGTKNPYSHMTSIQ